MGSDLAPGQNTCPRACADRGGNVDANVAERIFLGRLRRNLLANATGSVLDVACGDGVNFRHYPANTRITAIDVETSAASRANRRANVLGRDIAVRTMDVHRLAFPDASFDTAVSSLALCSYRDPVAALREMSRVCTPGGTILLLEHGRSSFGPWAWWQDRQERRRGSHDGCHENREPLQLVLEAGLRIITARRTFFGVIHLIEARPAA